MMICIYLMALTSFDRLGGEWGVGSPFGPGFAWVRKETPKEGYLVRGLTLNPLSILSGARGNPAKPGGNERKEGEHFWQIGWISQIPSCRLLLLD